MLLDLESTEYDQSIDCDVCIVGAGAVGLAMGVRLARENMRVVLLEAGGISLEEKSQDIYRGSSVGHPFPDLHIGRYRVLGGSTIFWGGQVLPIDQHIMSGRPWMPQSAWPVSVDNLAPYHLEAYRLLGLSNAEMDDASVWQRLGISPEIGSSLELRLTRWTPQRNFARLFRPTIMKSNALQLIVHANVTGLQMDERGRRVSRIEARTHSGRRVSVRPKFAVLACGTLEIARLLLHPACKGGHLPWHSNQWIGRGFADHLRCDVADVQVLNRRAFHDLADSIHLNGFKYYPRIRLSPAAQRAGSLVDVSAEFQINNAFTKHLENIKMFVRSLVDGRRPDQLSKMPRHILSVAKISAPLVLRYLFQHRSYKPSNSQVRLVLSSEQLPNRHSCVRLGEDRDAFGMRRIVVDWRIDGREIESFAVFARCVREEFAARGIARVNVDPDLECENPAFMKKVYDDRHQMSSARMGNSPKDGVVDANLKVFGADNFFIAGQAVFPPSGFANPTFTAIALGLRLCDHLTEKTL